MPKSIALVKQPNEHKVIKKPKPTGQPAADSVAAVASHLGNGAIQRLLAQRSGGDSAFDLDDATAGRINAARSGGQALDGTVQTQMSQSIGADFSGVRVHTGSEAHQLNEQLSAKAFTTGRDVFFREGEYNPGSSSGQELIAHELTHVVQQGSGTVSGGAGSGGGAMRVNAPGDHFEQEADAVAKTVNSRGTAPAVQRQTPEEDEVQTKLAQRQEVEDEEVQTMHLQRQEMEDGEEIQRQELPEEEEEPPVQMQELPEEEQTAV